MSHRGNTLPAPDGPPVYLRGDYARDISRLLDLSPDHEGLFLDWGRMDGLMRLRINIAVAMAHYYMDCQTLSDIYAERERIRLIKYLEEVVVA